MESAYLPIWVIVSLASFLGALPFGIVNLNVVDTTLKKSSREGILMAAGATLTEFVHAFVAIHCAAYFSKGLENNPYIRTAVFIVFLLLGMFFFFKKQQPPPRKKRLRMKVSNFSRGMFLSLINPQAIPFWLFVITYITSHKWFKIQGDNIPSFLLGVGLGKFFALIVFVYFSLIIRKRMGQIGNFTNKIIGSIFFVLAIVQAARSWL